MTPAEVKIRGRIVEYCEWGIRNQARIHYAQARPIPHGGPPSSMMTLPLATDCSGFATMAYRFAGAPDPNGNGYDGHGYTGTMLQHGVKVTMPRVGDLILFGAFPGHHVTLFLTTWHGAWVTCSHGGEYGPIRILNHREEMAQGVPYQVRRYL